MCTIYAILLHQDAVWHTDDRPCAQTGGRAILCKMARLYMNDTYKYIYDLYIPPQFLKLLVICSIRFTIKKVSTKKIRIKHEFISICKQQKINNLLASKLASLLHQQLRDEFCKHILQKSNSNKQIQSAKSHEKGAISFTVRHLHAEPKGKKS